MPKRPARALDRTRRNAGRPSASTASTVSARIFPAMVNSLLMYDVLGVPDDRRARKDGARIDRAAARRQRRRKPIASPASRRCGTRRSSAHALLETGDDDARERARQASTGSRRLQVLDVKGDWAAQRPDRAARRLGLSIRQRLLPGRRRHGRRRDRDGPPHGE